MRRPRYKLQVSTFPFLAVLLCAMGSLLLFLFIMDRRAKIAAQHTSDEVLQARKKRTQDEEDALQAEWLKAKEKLHQALLLTQGDLDGKAKGLQIDLTDAQGKLRLLQTHYLELKDQAKDEAGKIAEIQLQIAGRRAGLLDADKKETMSKKELIAAATELAELELAFQQLLAVKEREKQVHSLVPYNGKRGDSRTPIYIECVGSGLIFHPEERVLQGRDLTPNAVREEVERRSGTLTLRRSSDKEKPGTYILFLVRPNGITNYYRTQSVLKSFNIDFGYELIDQAWELDFGGKTLAKNRPIAPLKRTEMPIDNRPTIEPPSFGQESGVRSQGSAVGSQGSGFRGQGSGDGFGPGPIAQGSGVRGQKSGDGFGPDPILPPRGGTGLGPIPLPGGSASGLPPIGPIGKGPATLSNDGGASGLPPIGPACKGPAIMPGDGGGLPPIGPVGKGPGIGIGKGPAFVPINKIQPPVPIASADDPMSSGGNEPNPPSGNGPYPSSGGTGPNPGANPPNGGNVPNPGGSAGLQPPAPNPGDKALPGAPSPLPRTNSVGNAGAPNGTSSPEAPNGSGGVGDGGAQIGPPSTSFGNVGSPNKKPAPPPLGRVLGNKDFVIFIDCYDDHINIFPGGMSFRWNANNMKTTDSAFSQAVAKLIERRQASVRKGEPPYRPVICFRVGPDGRHSYLHVYPLLESLNVPMTRENVVEQ